MFEWCVCLRGLFGLCACGLRMMFEWSVCLRGLFGFLVRMCVMCEWSMCLHRLFGLFVWAEQIIFRLTTTPTNRDTDKLLLINQTITEVHSTGRLFVRSQKKRSVLLGGEHVLSSTTNGEYKSCVTGVSYVVSGPVRGCMLQLSLIHI